MLARIAYHQQDLPRMLVASLRQLNAAERTVDPALKAEAYAYVATAARIAGRHRLAARYGTLADHALASVEHPSDAENRARLARGIDQLYSGGFEDARRSLTEGRARTLDPRMAESCVGMLAETALWRGDFAAAADLFAKTEELAVARVGDDIGRHWCLMGRAEALLRVNEVPVERVRKVVAAARASVERRLTREKELGLRDGPGMRAIQDLRLLTASARLDARQEPGDDGPTRARSALTEALALAARLPSAQPGMLECWTGLAELLWSIATDQPGADGRSPVRQDRAAARLLYAHLSRYLARYPGTAARIGWARCLPLAAAGRRKAALRAAERAMADAERLDAPYDHRRAELLARRFGSHA
ncbi:hypothetical protein ACQEVF_20165 [Nonomuraea polychroma]|uniref:hypothetical protein n=1 Tax=Nonomuraea polychroma TaxID=46176 RepID=UPI003D942113